jgi:hypothetical protein
MMSGECCRAPLQATGRAGKYSAALAAIAAALTWCLRSEDGGPSTCCQRRCSSATLAVASSPTPRPLMPVYRRVRPGEQPLQRHRRAADPGALAVQQLAAGGAGGVHARGPRVTGRRAGADGTVAAQADESAPAGSDTQLAYVRAFTGVATSAKDLAFLAALLDGSAVLEGLSVDTDLRWSLLGRLVSVGWRVRTLTRPSGLHRPPPSASRRTLLAADRPSQPGERFSVPGRAGSSGRRRAATCRRRP